MNFENIFDMIKGLIPILEPLGEQGIGQLFAAIDAEIAKMSQSDFKDAAIILSPALKAFALLEVRKLKA